jgi:prevent-host-death family protein
MLRTSLMIQLRPLVGRRGRGGEMYRLYTLYTLYSDVQILAEGAVGHGVWSVVEARAQLSGLLDRVQREGYQIISRNGHQAAVVVPMADWSGPSPPTAQAWRSRPPDLRLSDDELDALFARVRARVGGQTLDGQAVGQADPVGGAP